MKSYLALALATFVMGFTAMGQDGDEAEFREALKDTPFADMPYRPGDPIPRVPSKNEMGNLDRYVEHVDRLGISYVHLIERFRLHDELGLSKEQIAALSRTISPTAESVKSALTTGDPLKLSPKAFTAFLRDFEVLSTQAYRKADEEVERILNRRQLSRLRQIGFQYYLYHYIVPQNAMRFQEREISSEQLSELMKAAIDAKTASVQLVSTLRSLSIASSIEDIGKKPVRSEMGEMVGVSHFGVDVLDTLETYIAPPAKTKSNPRRRRTAR